MSDPTALDSARTGTPDAATGTALATVVSSESASVEIPTGIALSDAVANAIGAHRAGLTAADATVKLIDFGASSCGTESVNNRGAIALWMTFASSCGSATVSPIYYDAQSTPQPLAVGAQLTFAALDLRGASGFTSCGDPTTRLQMVDSMGARKFKVRLDSLTNSADGASIWAVPI